jgi:uncharacterized C2H2 Zn-finger protein
LLYSYLIGLYVTFAVEIAFWNNLSICEHGFINTYLKKVMYLLLYVVFSWVPDYFCNWWMNLNMLMGECVLMWNFLTFAGNMAGFQRDKRSTYSSHIFNEVNIQKRAVCTSNFMNQSNSNNLSFLEEQVTQLLQGEQSSSALTAGSVWGVAKAKKWSGSGSFQCPGCGKVYRWRKNMISHMRLECGKEPQFQCPHCPQRTTQKSSLLTHIYNKHRQWNRVLWVALLWLWCTEQANIRY